MKCDNNEKCVDMFRCPFFWGCKANARLLAIPLPLVRNYEWLPAKPCCINVNAEHILHFETTKNTEVNSRWFPKWISKKTANRAECYCKVSRLATSEFRCFWQKQNTREVTTYAICIPKKALYSRANLSAIRDCDVERWWYTAWSPRFTSYTTAYEWIWVCNKQILLWH